MARIVLIHGTSVGVKFSIFRDRCIIDGGFKGLKHELETGEAVLFRWHQENQSLNFLQSMEPTTVPKIYLNERKYILSSEALSEMNNFLIKEKPEIIIAHSLGCHYLLNTIQKHSVPTCVTKIFLLMSEAPRNFDLNNPEIVNRIEDNNLSITNYFCWWDPTIFSSTLLTGKIPSGTFAFKNKNIINKFYPISLDLRSDPHTKISRDRKFLSKLISK